MTVNPFRPPELLTAQHMQEMVTEAIQDWIQKQSKPYMVDGFQEPRHVTDYDMHRILTLVRAMIDQNKDTLNVELNSPAATDTVPSGELDGTT